ncbi:MAG: hypothetical protein AAFY41_15070, partial [Bacteroidota bacterium]
MHNSYSRNLIWALLISILEVNCSSFERGAPVQSSALQGSEALSFNNFKNAEELVKAYNRPHASSAELSVAYSWFEDYVDCFAKLDIIHMRGFR